MLNKMKEVKGEKMKIDKLLKDIGLNYKKEEYDDYINIYKIRDKKNLNIITMVEKGNIFKIDSDLFYYLDNQKELYSFLLIDRVGKSYYYLDFKNKMNWLKSSFERSNKEEIYFGKTVLNNKITENNLKIKLETYK